MSIPKKINNNQTLINILSKSIDIYILNNIKKLPKIIEQGTLYFIPKSTKNKYTIEFFRNNLYKYREKKDILNSLYFPSGRYYFLDFGFTLKTPLYIY